MDWDWSRILDTVDSGLGKYFDYQTQKLPNYQGYGPGSPYYQATGGSQNGISWSDPNGGSWLVPALIAGGVIVLVLALKK